MTDHDIDDISTQIGDRLSAYLSPLGAGPRPITHGLTHGFTAADLDRFAVDVGGAAYTIAQRLLQERDTIERIAHIASYGDAERDDGNAKGVS